MRADRGEAEGVMTGDATRDTTGGDRTVGVVGTGVIGAGWAVRALARGLDVVAWDPAPGAEERLRAAVDRA